MSSINYKKGVEEAIWLYKVAYLSVKELRMTTSELIQKLIKEM